jgi:hypothetical protein
VDRLEAAEVILPEVTEEMQVIPQALGEQEEQLIMMDLREVSQVVAAAALVRMVKVEQGQMAS